MIKLNIQNKISFYIAIPLLLILSMGIYTIDSKTKTLYRAKIVAKNIKILLNSITLITSLQRERGLSAILLNNPEQNISAVNNQIIDSKKAMTALQEELSSSKSSSLIFKENFGNLTNEIESIRSKVAERHIPSGDAIKLYTSVIRKLINIGTTIQQEDKNEFGQNIQLTNIIILIEAQESMGALRANLSGIFASNKSLEMAQLDRLYSIFSAVKDHLNSPGLILSSEAKEYRDAIVNLPEWKFVDEKMHLAIQKKDSGNYDVDAKDFFSKATVVISAIIKITQVEKSLIEIKIAKIEKNAFENITLVGFLLVLVFVILFILIIKFLKDINKMAKELVFSNQEVLKMSYELAKKNKDLAERTHGQSQSLQSTAAAIEELTSVIKQTLSGSKESGIVSDEAANLAIAGQQESNQGIKAMEEIARCSHQINEIVSLVEEIAFQTNILAINAAIEAAKASEHGKGFAVVAIEVRDLAQRASQAAKDIFALVKTTQEKVIHGEKVVKENNIKLAQLVIKINQVAKTVESIIHSGNEQYGAIEDINKSITNLDHLTQQNSTMVDLVSEFGKKLTVASENSNNIIKLNLGN